jgi:hypothetical protein
VATVTAAAISVLSVLSVLNVLNVLNVLFITFSALLAVKDGAHSRVRLKLPGIVAFHAEGVRSTRACRW